MKVVLIAKKEMNEYILKLLNEYNKHIVLNYKDSILVEKEMIRIGQLNIEHLIIDYDLVEDKENFIAEIKRLKIVKRDVKITVIISGREVGNRVLKKIVTLGVYNIITESNTKEILLKMNTVLTRGISYREVVKYDVDITSGEQNYKKKDVHVIGGKIIAGSGSRKGIGVTHTLIMLGMYLRKKHKVAIVELNGSQDFKDLFQVLYDREPQKKFTYKKLDFFWGTSLSEFMIRYKNNYEYIILDFGYLHKLKYLENYLKADLQLFLLDGVDWKIKSSMRAYDYLKENSKYSRNVFLVPFLEEKYIKELGAYIDSAIYKIPFNMNPFKISDSTMEAFECIFNLKIQKNFFNNFLKGGFNGIWKKKI